VFAQRLRGVDAFQLVTSFLVMCWRALVWCLQLWQHLLYSLHYVGLILLCIVFQLCSTLKLSGCLVFAQRLRGVDAFHVVTSFLVMCCKELVWLLATVATPSILTSLCWLDFVVHCVSAVQHIEVEWLACVCSTSKGSCCIPCSNKLPAHVLKRSSLVGCNCGYTFYTHFTMLA
jgi:hypothetical protein